MTRYPVGFYALGRCLEPLPVQRQLDPEDIGYGAMRASLLAPRTTDVIAKWWSTQGIEAVEPGTVFSFSHLVEYPTRVETVHCWGFCRIVQVNCGHYNFEPKDGCLFVPVNRTLETGVLLAVVVEALSGV